MMPNKIMTQDEMLADIGKIIESVTEMPEQERAMAALHDLCDSPEQVTELLWAMVKSIQESRDCNNAA